MNNSESARKLNQAVNTTSKAVGGAILQAKGAFSNFWSSFTAPTVQATVPVADDLTNETSVIEPETETITTNGGAQKKPNQDGDKRNCDVEKLSETLKQLDSDQPNLNLREENDSGADLKHGIVEIGREAKAFDSNSKSEDVIGEF